VEPEETSISRQQLGKHISVTTPNNGSTVERECFPLGPSWGYIKRNPGQLKGLRSEASDFRVGSSLVKKRVRL
jgi:hypothetical protein